MRTDDARHLVSRVFGSIGGALTGIGVALAQWGLALPIDGARQMLLATLVVIGAVLSCTFGIGMTLSALTARGIARLDIFVFWVLVPAIVGYGAAWWLLQRFN